VIKKKARVNLIHGLQARNSVGLIEITSKYKSKITIKKTEDDYDMDAKIILDIMSIGVEHGVYVIIAAEGEDEKEAIDAITYYLEKHIVGYE
jgi:phosphotransferase system HPr (HPr) family protein